jgi:hypothetical protein
LGRKTMAMIEAGRDVLFLKRASASRSSGEWNDDDYDVLANGAVADGIFEANAAPVGSPWMWTLAFGSGGTSRGWTPVEVGVTGLMGVEVITAFAARSGRPRCCSIRETQEIVGKETE